jgi:hypothetical protein
MVNIGVRETDIVFVCRYRLRGSRTGWRVYVQNGDKWGTPKRFATKKRALDAIAEHARSGKWTEASADPIGELQRRIVALDTWRDAVEDDIARMREQLGEQRDGSVVVNELVTRLHYIAPHPQDDPENA